MMVIGLGINKKRIEIRRPSTEIELSRLLYRKGLGSIDIVGGFQITVNKQSPILKYFLENRVRFVAVIEDFAGMVNSTKIVIEYIIINDMQGWEKIDDTTFRIPAEKVGTLHRSISRPKIKKI